MPDVYGKVAGRLWEVCRTSMGKLPDVYGKYAGRLWEVCRTFMGSMPDIYGKVAGHLWEMTRTETSYAQNAIFLLQTFCQAQKNP
jgi:hypothetical protein